MYRFYFSFLFAIVSAVSVHAQEASDDVYTKDGTKLGSRKVLVSVCANSMNTVNSSQNSKEAMCGCMMDAMAKHLTYKELTKMTAKPDFDYTKLFNDRKHPKLGNALLECVGEYSKVVKQESGSVDVVRESFVKECIREASASTDPAAFDTEKYCNCAYDKIKENKIAMDEVNDMLKDTNSLLYTQVIVKCVEEAKK